MVPAAAVPVEPAVEAAGAVAATMPPKAVVVPVPLPAMEAGAKMCRSEQAVWKKGLDKEVEEKTFLR